MSERYLKKQIQEDLHEKMVFLGGPRQVGKTTLAKNLLDSKSAAGYLSWDVAEDRDTILRRELPRSPMWVFDEFHKYRRWRNYLKGLYDSQGDEHQILVTGSARLEHFRFGGDSLQGRYHYLRLHPWTVAELGDSSPSTLTSLLTLGGFPEPLFSGSKVQAARWSLAYRERLIREDILSVEHIHDIGQLELLAVRLPDLVGSPLSLNALREDLQVSHKTLGRWVSALENVYSIYRLAPFGAPKLRAIKKANKHYHFDWTLVPEPGPRFENLVASHLLKWVHHQHDTLGRELELNYFRDIDGREVDFIVTERRKPVGAIEVKHGKNTLDPSLRYFKQRFPECKSYQISATDSKDAVTPEGIRLCPANLFLSTLV